MVACLIFAHQCGKETQDLLLFSEDNANNQLIGLYRKNDKYIILEASKS